MAGENNPIFSELTEVAARNVSEAEQASVRQVMVNKAVLKFRNALTADPTASLPATQEKIKQGLELKGLTEAEKVAVASAALDKMQGTGKPSVAVAANQPARQPAEAPRDHVAELRALQHQLENTPVNDAELRAAALERARAFIAGKEGEVLGVIARQTPEIQARAQAFMSKVDSLDSMLVEGFIRDVADQAKLNFVDMNDNDIKHIKEVVTKISGEAAANALTPEQMAKVKSYIEENPVFHADISDTDIDRIKVTVKSLVADAMATATSPAEIQKTLDNIDMSKMFNSAMEGSFKGLEAILAKTPTAAEALGMAAQAVGAQADAMEATLKAQEAERQRVRDMKENDPEAYKAFCAEPENRHNPIVVGECADAIKAPKM